MARAALVIYLIVVMGFVVVPVLYAIVGAFAPQGQLHGLVPGGLTLDNFVRALTTTPVLSQLGNSVIVTVCQTTAQLLTSLLAAYAITFGNFRHPQLVLGFFVVTMMVPGETTIIANYMTITQLGLFNTLLAIFMPFLASAYGIFLLRQSFMSFPKEIHEAATLDGVSAIQFLFQFLVPLCRPTILVVVLTSAIAAWNGYFWPLLVTDDPAVRTVQVGIAQLSDASATNTGAVLAGVVLVSIPMSLLIIFGQKILTQGLTQGATK